MEGVVRGVLAAAPVSFAATYALGHVARRYYAQGRKLSQEDLRALFTRFQQEARELFPSVQARIQSQASGLNLQTVLATLQGG